MASELRSHESEVFILLASYNGERYVQQQIESIQTQTHRQWRLVIRDDGSSDTTIDAMRAKAEGDHRITILPSSPTPQGAAGNFSQLMAYALDQGAEYIFLCDQDDVWHPEKVRAQLAVLRQAEGESQSPVLIHSDLRLIDESGHLIHDSFFRFQRYQNPRHRPLETLLAHNFVTGCTILMNRPLLQAALPMPAIVTDHDWWLATVAAAMGSIFFFPEPTVAYRQHSQNLVGARGYWWSMNPLTAGWRGLWDRHRSKFCAHRNALVQLLPRLEATEKHPEECKLISGYLAALKAPWVSRIRAVARLDVGGQTYPRKILFWLLVIFAR